ncbi:diaminopimelate decarboxylase [Apibacter sp. HY039]|uniref:diaminopimelate decarboxylase n=1 Tax=Apibacter sp. HY039 TaxID=2501476 RepID=UPI000FEC1EC7|nr:diaminopimelate decarboxylase [Apibacter sp. HY039]
MELARMHQMEEIAREYGAPLYIYDSAVIEEQFARLTRAFQGVKDVKLNYACKANTNINIIKFIRNLGSGLDAVSINEIKLGLRAGFLPQEIIFTPSGVHFNEIREAAELGVKIHIDNFPFLRRFAEEFPDYPIGIRINPHIKAGGNEKISTGHVDSKFGISIDQVDDIVDLTRKIPLKVDGLHVHTGSDILDIDVFLEGAKVLFGAAENFPSLTYLDFGSGFKVPYKEGDKETDIVTLGNKLGLLFNEFVEKYKKPLRLIFEPGKFLVSQCGLFVTEVNVVKETPYRRFAFINSGFNHLIRPMFYNAFHHIVNLSNPDSKNEKTYDVVGYICETDTFASDRKIAEIHEGDYLCFENAGAYCFSMSSNYNSRVRPAEVLLLNGAPHLIRRKENFENLLETTVEISL